MKYLFLILLLVSQVSWGLSEATVVQQDCSGHIEYRLPDKTRVDCLTVSHATEYDWCEKWGEAIGQSLWYAANTGRRAGIVLIQRAGKACPGFHRLSNTIEHYNLPITYRLLVIESL